MIQTAVPDRQGPGPGEHVPDGVCRRAGHGFGYWFKAILVNKSVQQTKGQLPSNSSDFLVFEQRRDIDMEFAMSYMNLHKSVPIFSCQATSPMPMLKEFTRYGKN